MSLGLRVTSFFYEKAGLAHGQLAVQSFSSFNFDTTYRPVRLASEYRCDFLPQNIMTYEASQEEYDVELRDHPQLTSTTF